MRVRPRRIAVSLAALAVLFPVPSHAAPFDTRVVAHVPEPGYPAHAYVHSDGLIYAGTYVNPGGNPTPSRVFEYTLSGNLNRYWSVPGQVTSGDHGVQVATSDARGRLVLLDHTPARALLLDPKTGAFTTYATFKDLPGDGEPIPDYAVWGPDGSLYVTDYGQGGVWRVPPGGGTPTMWLTDPRLAGGLFGTTGIALGADHRTLYVDQAFEGDGLATGGLFKTQIGPGGKPGGLTKIWGSHALDLPDGLAIARSGRIFIAGVGPSQLIILDRDGHETQRFPRVPLSGYNGSAIPFDGLSSVAFDGNDLITASQSILTGNSAHWAIHDVQVGEPGVPELIPRNAGLADAVAPAVSRVRLSSKAVKSGRATRLVFRLSEKAKVTVRITRRSGRRTITARRIVGPRAAGARSVRISTAHLKRGRYRILLTATDSAGNTSRAARVSLRVVPR
jgi:sugar lactone lactonase YvrE